MNIQCVMQQSMVAVEEGDSAARMRRAFERVGPALRGLEKRELRQVNVNVVDVVGRVRCAIPRIAAMRGRIVRQCR